MSSKYAGQCSGVASFVSNRHGKFYATLVGISADGDVVAIGILGPYESDAKASYWADRWQRRNNKVLASGKGSVAIPDGNEVPEDVRCFITTDITNAIRQRGAGGVVPGTVFQRAGLH